MPAGSRSGPMMSPVDMLRMLSAPQPSHRKQAIRFVKTAFLIAASMGSRRVPDSGTGVMLATMPHTQHFLLAIGQKSSQHGS